jgi:hypothetical protein
VRSFLDEIAREERDRASKAIWDARKADERAARQREAKRQAAEARAEANRKLNARIRKHAEEVNERAEKHRRQGSSETDLALNLVGRVIGKTRREQQTLRNEVSFDKKVGKLKRVLSGLGYDTSIFEFPAAEQFAGGLDRLPTACGTPEPLTQ